MDENGHNDEPKLTREEIVRLKKIAKEDERVEWLWGVMRKFGTWIFAIVAALAAFRDDIAKLMGWK